MRFVGLPAELKNIESQLFLFPLARFATLWVQQGALDLECRQGGRGIKFETPLLQFQINGVVWIIVSIVFFKPLSRGSLTYGSDTGVPIFDFWQPLSHALLALWLHARYTKVCFFNPSRANALVIQLQRELFSNPSRAF